MEEITGFYTIELVLVSLLIAIVSSYTSLLIVRRMLLSQRQNKQWGWLISGSLTFGGGIWSMHFVAMLAYQMDMTVTYDSAMLGWSIICAGASSFTAFFIINKNLKNRAALSVSAVFIATGILSMHYIGMEAMQMRARIDYNPWMVLVSVLIALLASFGALYIFTSQQKDNKRSTPVLMWGSAVLMGIAISGMHYTGMTSASFYMDKQTTAPLENRAVVQQGTLGYLIAITILIILGFMVILVYYNRKLEDTHHQYSLADKIYRSIVESANDAIITANKEGRILSWNKAAEEIFGFNANEMLNQPLTAIMPASYRSAHEIGIQSYIEARKAQVIDQTVQLEGLHKNNGVFPIELSLSTIEEEGEIYFTGLVRDVSERMKSQERIKELVYKDELTHLPNRRMLYDHLSSCVQHAKKTKEIISVMFLDLNRFKQVNDVYGHKTGDELLRQLSARIQQHLSEQDMLARQSGDEFVIVCPQTTTYKTGNLANDIIQAVRTPFVIAGKEIYMSMAIGISIFPDNGSTVDVLIKNADTAMYQSKQKGDNKAYFFTEEMNELISKKMQLEYGLRKAIEKEELLLYYQPQVNVKTGKVKGVEALIRWNHPELGLISPLEFIPLAEETNLIIPMGEWILQEACSQFKQWLNQGYKLDHISINISSLQFREPDFAKLIQRVLEENQLKPECLELEITESVVQDSNEAIPIMHTLKNMGVKLSLDDFGTGYSSLRYLKDFPLDVLKIDKSFVQTVYNSNKDQAVIDTIIDMADRLELSVIAEGVETIEQLNYLNEKNCLEYQGFLFSAPVSKNQIPMLLSQGVQPR
ncbi:bifunctional diguanylate cyclase/phosphodiesterase [Halobacillus litoralis]|uniref:bifunctional diguanylate cyclase/phosphodiesterase n=1 Tax=Halobacillus litoralis TaxID=45668 RepID=UPI001CFE349D|nr:bifunctional diguanylate cyclase/phosphodiesterase [Halobacillus litoralis]